MRSSRSQTQQFAQHWPSGRFSVTALLIAISVAAGTAELAIRLSEHPEPLFHRRLVEWLALHGSAVTSRRWWQFLSFPLLHPNPGYLLLNVAMLWLGGREVEPIVGVRHYSLLCLAGTLAGGVVQWTVIALGLAPSGMLVAGVSGGAAAVLAAYATILPELEVALLHVRAKALGMTLVAVATGLCLLRVDTLAAPAAVLTGCLIGWAWAKRLGFGNPMAIERYLFDKRQHAARLERMPADQFIREELDPILEKIVRTGKGSLTRAERKLLEKGRSKLAARDTQPLVQARPRGSGVRR